VTVDKDTKSTVIGATIGTFLGCGASILFGYLQARHGF
jgi:hypothetical protein